MKHFWRVAAVCSLTNILCCSRGEPPTWDSETSGAISPIPPSLVDSAVVAPDAASAKDEDSGALPQTHDRPLPSGADFERRANALWDAIVKDDPALAMPFFFPAAAYAQVKAIANPSADWRHRLVANFTRDIHAAHEKIGKHAADATFVSLDVPMDRARWVEPFEEGNKIGYFRVYGSKLRYEIPGKSSPMSIDVTSLISWRGEWYVVHLNGFK